MEQQNEVVNVDDVIEADEVFDTEEQDEVIDTEQQNEVVVTDGIAAEAAARMNKLVEARNACVSGIKAGDGMIITYARTISEVCGEGWVYLIGKESAPVREERKLFNRAMGLPDEVLTESDKKLRAKCSTYWQRIREAAGYIPAGKVTAPKTVDEKSLAELKTMLNRIFNEEGEGDNCPLSSAAKGSLIDAFETLGGDVSKLGTKG